MHLVGVVTRIYYDARSPERQIQKRDTSLSTTKNEIVKILFSREAAIIKA